MHSAYVVVDGRPALMVVLLGKALPSDASAAAGLVGRVRPAPRCCHPDLAEDGDGALVERCCDGLLIARRRRPLWTR